MALVHVAPRGRRRGRGDWRLSIRPQEWHHLLVQHGMWCGAIRGMLPLWFSPWQGWRFRLGRYTSILSLEYAVKQIEEVQDIDQSCQ